MRRPWEWDIRPKLKCAKCGGKAVGLIYTPDMSPNAYGKARTGDNIARAEAACISWKYSPSGRHWTFDPIAAVLRRQGEEECPSREMGDSSFRIDGLHFRPFARRA